MAISFDSIGQVCVTCINSGVQINCPCKFSTSCAVANCLDENAFDGVVVARRGNLATVAVRGFVTVAYSGSTVPTVGYCPLAAAGSGKVKKLNGAREYLVASVDTGNKTVTFCL